MPQSLKLRAGKLIGKYPLLKGCILDVKTTVPKWRYRSDGEVVSGLDTLVKDEHLDNQVRISFWKRPKFKLSHDGFSQVSKTLSLANSTITKNYESARTTHSYGG